MIKVYVEIILRGVKIIDDVQALRKAAVSKPLEELG
jgi:hypothetical protein